jgi:N-acylneuraminate cytidylyltransferase/CMP-N,N'-diacetyllegionaminic acid synthase
MENKNIAIIPARGGSKGIPRKNIKKLGGKPLIAYTIETAIKTKCIDRTIVSTDDPEIAEIAKNYGVEVPFLRPSYLAEDDVPVLPVVQHSVKELEKENYKPDIVVVLQPTSPFRKSEDIERAVDKLIETNADCVVTLSEVEQHPYRMRRLVGDKPIPLFEVDEKVLYAQRQDFPKIYMMNGAIYACKKEPMMKQTVFYGQDIRAIVIEKISAWDIDTIIDFQIAELIVKERASKWGLIK